MALTYSCRKTTVSNKIDLAGEWQFAIDSLDAGVTEKWFAKNLGDVIQLPNSLTTNGKGDDIGWNTPWTGQGVTDTLITSFGMREFTVANRQILINGNPVFLRGTLECAIFPKTGFPPTDKAEWLRILNICRAHGLNHLRFHSWCPPKAAFEAADEAGFYFQVETSSWPNQSTSNWRRIFHFLGKVHGVNWDIRFTVLLYPELISD